MRTTLTLDDDIAERLRQEMRRTGKSLDSVVNDAVRAVLGDAKRPVRAERFVVEPTPSASGRESTPIA